jgi:hypothetical protein
LVDIIASIKSNSQAAELVEPTQRAFRDPAVDTQAAAVFRIATSQVWFDSSLSEFLSMRLRIVRSIRVQGFRSLLGMTGFARHRRNAVHQGQQLGDVVAVRSGQCGVQGNPLRISQHVMLTARFAAIRRVWIRFSPPPTARTEELSAVARDQSI